MVKNCALIIFSLASWCCSGNPVIVLDDKDGSDGFFSMTKAYKGTYAPWYEQCLDDAFQGQFVHDWAQNKGSSSATFSFDPPKNGCYLVEEYHPGRSESCSRYLPKAANLQIGYCRGQTSEVTIDQSRDGGKWNTLGKWPFYVGQEGYFKMYNSERDSCDAEQCFWVADAFRVTWIGNNCRTPAPATSVVEVDTSDEHASKDASKEEDKTHEVDGIAKEEDSPDKVDSHEVGTLSLMVASGDNSEDLELKIKNLGVLEVALKQRFGYKSVNLLSVNIVSQRRLSELLGSASDRRIDVEFEGIGNSGSTDNEQTLAQVLQGLFDARDAGILVKSADVSWDVSSTGQSPDEGNRKPVFDWLALGGCLLAGIVLLGVFAWRMRKFAMKKYAAENKDVGVDEKEVPEDPEQAVKVKDEAQDDVVSVSTAPPASSDADGRSESGSVTQDAANEPERP